MVLYGRDNHVVAMLRQSQTMEFTVLLGAVLSLSLCCDAMEVFHVKPTVGNTTDCPSPCYPLQYYVKHSNFTSNSMFLFLIGEHHLDSLVDIKNLANLSLVGADSGVKILCQEFLSSGFHFAGVVGLLLENIAVENCKNSRDSSIELSGGSDAILNGVSISTPDSAGLEVRNVTGSISILNCTFISKSGDEIMVLFSDCSKPSYFTFRDNRVYAASGLTMSIRCSNVQLLIDNSSFEGSSQYDEGINVYLEVLTNNSLSIQNSLFKKAFIDIHTCGFDCNETNLLCSDDFIQLVNITFYSKLTFYVGQMKNCSLLIENATFYSDSRLDFQSRAMEKSSKVVLRNVNFFVNGSLPGSASFSYVDALLVNCTFENSSTPAILARYGTTVFFQGINIFRNNSALVGGAIQLISASTMHLLPHTTLLFEGNRADYVGGAIYTDYDAKGPCFLDMNPELHNNTAKIKFSNNTALAGTSLYCGGIENCCTGPSCANFYKIFDVSNTEEDPSAIVSEPDDVCLCMDDKHQPNCSSFNRDYSTTAYPGQDFYIRLAVVSAGYFQGVVPGAIRAYIESPYNDTLGAFQESQTSHKASCKNFPYSVNTIQTERKLTFMLASEQYFFKTITNEKTPSFPLRVTVYLKDCPLGFTLSVAMRKCVCASALNSAGVQCNINDRSFLRPANTWIGFIAESSNISNVSGTIFHPNCPLSYCLPHDVNITMDTSDSQCASRRTGLLCGQCEEGYSLKLANGKCAECSHIYLLLVLPFAVLGLLLVVIQFALNLTVTEGTINGLIFYANVIGMNHSLLFSEETSYLYTFLAWINLDLGISTCLYDGMDGYTEAWLQFAFPAYLWILIVVIIQIYRKFPMLANKVGGENSVKALATLLLLSYAKLQRNVVLILSFTTVTYPDGVIRYVWLHDANLEFFKGKHLYLGIAGILVLVFLIIPYTLCLAFFQQLQSFSDHKFLQWVNKLKPVFDAYAGPYKDKYRFWTGMLLVVRTLLIIIFTANTKGSVEFNLMIISVVSCALLLANTHGAYKKWPCNYLESFFYLQLVVFAVGVAYARLVHGNITSVADTSFGLTLVTFLTVVGYHALRRVQSCKKRLYHLKGYADLEDEDPPLVNRMY